MNLFLLTWLVSVGCITQIGFKLLWCSRIHLLINYVAQDILEIKRGLEYEIREQGSPEDKKSVYIEGENVITSDAIKILTPAIFPKHKPGAYTYTLTKTGDSSELAQESPFNSHNLRTEVINQIQIFSPLQEMEFSAEYCCTFSHCLHDCWWHYRLVIFLIQHASQKFVRVIKNIWDSFRLQLQNQWNSNNNEIYN